MRIIALILAFLMVIGGAYYVIYLLTLSVSAEQTDVYDTSSLKTGGDVLISVGLMYGDNITTGFQVTSDTGFVIGKQQLHDSKDFVPVWDLADTVISCTSDMNLTKNGMSYASTDGWLATAIGGYHVQVDCDDLDRDGFENLIYNTQSGIWNVGLYAIPSYIYTGYAIRIGAFSTWNEANNYIEYFRNLYPDRYVSVVSPQDTAVSIVDPMTDSILFEFDCGSTWNIGLSANEDYNGNTYMKTPAGNYYDGVFCFKRYYNGKLDGVSLVNILPLEAYLAGVLPFELTNTWPIEVMKEFAITVRSFTLTHLGKHSAYDFDLCNTTDCQMYKGAGRINDTVMRAVLETRGQVLSYNGDIVTAYYSSSMGGVTVSVKDAWGGAYDVPYLQAIETPWEDYLNHSNGFWIYEVTPAAIRDRLIATGHNEIKGEIVDIEILEFAKNSTYVKKLRLTDSYGTSVTLTYSDIIRTTLSSILKSANFVVGRGSVDYTVYESTAKTIDAETKPAETTGSNENNERTETYGRDYGYISLDSYYIISSDSVQRSEINRAVTVLTSNGEVSHKKNDIFVISRDNAAAFLGEEYDKYSSVTEDTDANEDDTNNTVPDGLTLVTKTATASDSNNFVFVGKGWGHGVGISQYGSYDLAMLGYSAEEILKAYFVGVDIVNYRETNNFR